MGRIGPSLDGRGARRAADLILAVFALAVAALAVATATTPAAAQDFGKYQFKSRQLAPRLYMLTGAGGNLAALVGEDGALLVDSDYTPMAGKLKAALAALDPRPVRLVVNTHWHFDHVGGNESLARAGATIVAPETLRRRLAAGQRIAIIDEQVPPAPAVALPVVTFEDSLTLRLDGEEVLVYHPASAHTDGDAVVVFRGANVIHAGDIFFNCGYPFVDVSSGGGIDGLIAAGEAILRRCDAGTRIIPGHGELTDRAGLETYLGMLREFRAAIAREIAAGRSLEQVLAAKPTAALDEKWGRVYFPPAQFTEMVYRSLRP